MDFRYLWVTEPAIYGVTLPRMKQFVITCIGSALGAMYLGVFNILYYQMAGMGVFAVPGFIQTGGDTGTTLMHVGIALIISMVFSFIASFMTYKDDETTKTQTHEVYVHAPVEG